MGSTSSSHGSSSLLTLIVTILVVIPSSGSVAVTSIFQSPNPVFAVSRRAYCVPSGLGDTWISSNWNVPPGGGGAESTSSRYRGAQGLDSQFIKQLETQFGFDKPAHERFLKMLWDYARFDFGKSYFRDISVLELIKEKLPVSISLGLWMTLLSYAISILLGIKKAVRDGSSFDVWTSAAVSEMISMLFERLVVGSLE